jgi:hypothetical protein
VLHSSRMQTLAIEKVQEDCNQKQTLSKDTAMAGTEASEIELKMLILKAKISIANSKTFKERFFSYKAVHGILMFTSWVNIFGRIFASNISGDFTCYTYPIYKAIDTPHGEFEGLPITLVPGHDPFYSKLPWAKTGIVGWAVALNVGPLVGAFTFGAIYSFFSARYNNAKGKNVNTNLG